MDWREALYTLDIQELLDSIYQFVYSLLKLNQQKQAKATILDRSFNTGHIFFLERRPTSLTI
jgi:hypothetical protein